MKIGILTGGGDCPGLNAVIRAIVRRAQSSGMEVLGIRNGFLGLIEGDVEPLTGFSVTGILPKGGTILGTSRCNPLRSMEDRQTIDNDLKGTDYTFGFDTAVNVVRDAVDRLHTTAESHHRVMVVPFSIVVVAEGAFAAGEPPPERVGEGGTSSIGFRVAREIAERLEVETRVTVLGHIQRGGSPTAFDRIIATRFGIRAVDLVREGRFGHMVALHRTRIDAVPLSEATAGPKQMDLEQFADAEVSFG